MGAGPATQLVSFAPFIFRFTLLLDACGLKPGAAFMSDYQHRARKRFGQNFLHDAA
jgi:hypothetical protein